MKKYWYIILFILLLSIMAGGCSDSGSDNTSSKASLPQTTETETPQPTEAVTPQPTETVTPQPTEAVTPQPTETVTPQASEEETPKDNNVVSLEAAKEASEKEIPPATETVTPTPTPTAEESTSQAASETPMQLSDIKKKELIGIAEKYYGAKDVFASYGNGNMVVSYSIDSIPNPSALYDDIQGMLIAAYSIAGESGITDVRVVNVVVTTGSGRGLGVGNYYVAGERKTFDIDVSDCHP